MDATFWKIIASRVATYVKRFEPDEIPCKVRVRYRPRNMDLLAFVGLESGIPCHHFTAELEKRGYVVIGQGMSEGTSHWGVVVEAPMKNDWAGCIAYEADLIS